MNKVGKVFKSKLKKFLMIPVLITSFTIIGIGVIEYSFQNKEFKPFARKSRIWFHRVDDIKLLKSIKNSPSSHGIELDLVFQEGELFVSHDIPISSKLLFKDYLQEVPADFQMWLDLKNLTRDNIDSIESELNRINKITSFKERSLIESPNGEVLKKLSQKEFNTLFWVYPYPKSRAHFLYNLKNKYLIATSNFIGISMDYNNYDSRAKNTFNHCPKYLFTVNDRNALQEYKDETSIQVILSDSKEINRDEK